MAAANIIIRNCREEDLDRLREITIEAFDNVSIDQRIEQSFGTFHGHDWKWRKGEALMADWRREPSGLFVAEIEGRVVGGITTWHDAEAGVGFIPNLAVDATFRGKGIGRQLIEHALKHFRELRLSIARIETLSNNETGNHLYRSFGFVEVAQQIHFAMPLQNDK